MECIWTELIQVISKSHEFDLKSQVSFQTRIAWNKVQLTLYYRHFENKEYDCTVPISMIANMEILCFYKGLPNVSSLAKEKKSTQTN